MADATIDAHVGDLIVPASIAFGVLVAVLVAMLVAVAIGLTLLSAGRIRADALTDGPQYVAFSVPSQKATHQSPTPSV